MYKRNYHKYNFDNTDITDEIICDFLFKDGYIKSNLIRKDRLDYYSKIKDYLINRYPDTDDPKENAYRIYYKIDERPVCEVCGNFVKFEPRQIVVRGIPYVRFCCNACTFDSSLLKQERIDLFMKRYGVPYVPHNEDEIQKMKETNMKKYGVPYTFMSKEIRERGIETNLKRYGVSNFSKTDEFKIRAKAHVEERMRKDYETKKKNGTFRTSKYESTLLSLLKEHYSSVEYQWKDELYPYKCDFYIPSLRLYIEYQGTWLHCYHPYDINNQEDVMYADFLLRKYPKFFKDKHVWRVRDVIKRDTAIKNGLNYLEIYPNCKADFSDVIELIKDNYDENSSGKYIVYGASIGSQQKNFIEDYIKNVICHTSMVVGMTGSFWFVRKIINNMPGSVNRVVDYKMLSDVFDTVRSNNPYNIFLI